MISLRQKLLKRVQDWKNIRTSTNTVQDELDDKNITTSKTRSKRIISIDSPFPKGEKCFVDTENGGYFCAKRFSKDILLSTFEISYKELNKVLMSYLVKKRIFFQRSFW